MEILHKSITYKKIKNLGVGNFGTAYLVKCNNNDDDEEFSKFVNKQIDISGLEQDQRDKALKESKILEVLKHPNIVSFREVYINKNNQLCIVMEYIDGADLKPIIFKNYSK